MIKDMATTPEGAEAIYAEKIEQAQESFNVATMHIRLPPGSCLLRKEI